MGYRTRMLVRAGVMLGLAIVVGVVGAAEARTKAKVCRDECRSAIFACAAVSGKAARCGRAIVRDCRKRGPHVCRTNTTLPPGITPTTTTLPPSMPGVRLTVTDVDVVFELGAYELARPGFEFVVLDLVIENDGPSTIAGYGYAELLVDNLGYQQMFGLPNGSCDLYATVWPGGRLACRLAFEIPEGSTVATPLLGSGFARGEAIALPAPPVRPQAVLTAVDVGAAACTARPGFETRRVWIALASTSGATGLNLNAYAFSVVSAGAVYRPSYCEWPVDPCTDAVGVPVGGSATCTLIFELPLGAPAPAVVFDNARYMASTPLVD
jgi:hypothetical protein